MYRKEINEQSPLRILEASIHGGLGRGNLGVVMARAGVGKTACLVQIALDDLMRDRKVLHISHNGQKVEHILSWYDAIFDDLASQNHLEDREAVRASVSRNRLIKTDSTPLTADTVKRTISLYSEHLGFQPDAIIIDGFEWAPGDDTKATLAALKDCAKELDAELWMSAQTHRQGDETEGPLPAPCGEHSDVIDVALSLDPERNHVLLRLLKDHDNSEVNSATTLELLCDTMRLVVTGSFEPVGSLTARGYTLLSGAAPGSEAYFGECAQEWGLTELNYSFKGRETARKRGLVLLSNTELKQGAVSKSYLESQMHRTYSTSPEFKKILQSIWHQVNTAGEVFVVGVINEDGTVKGGTGWAAELGKHLDKTLHVFDQERHAWFKWNGKSWREAGEPTVTERRFTGTGTRHLSDDGKAAIRGLFERSFS